jgi:hypothetical protein
MTRKTHDYAVENHGSLFLLRPLHDAARENLEENTGEAQWFGGALAVEHRYIESLVTQLRDEGWTVR